MEHTPTSIHIDDIFLTNYFNVEVNKLSPYLQRRLTKNNSSLLSE